MSDDDYDGVQAEEERKLHDQPQGRPLIEVLAEEGLLDPPQPSVTHLLSDLDGTLVEARRVKQERHEALVAALTEAILTHQHERTPFLQDAEFHQWVVAEATLLATTVHTMAQAAQDRMYERYQEVRKAERAEASRERWLVGVLPQAYEHRAGPDDETVVIDVGCEECQLATRSLRRATGDVTALFSCKDHGHKAVFASSMTVSDW